MRIYPGHTLDTSSPVWLQKSWAPWGTAFVMHCVTMSLCGGCIGLSDNDITTTRSFPRLHPVKALSKKQKFHSSSSNGLVEVLLASLQRHVWSPHIGPTMAHLRQLVTLRCLPVLMHLNLPNTFRQLLYNYQPVARPQTWLAKILWLWAEILTKHMDKGIKYLQHSCKFVRAADAGTIIVQMQIDK